MRSNIPSQYDRLKLMTDNFVEETNPNAIFESWYAEAQSSEINDPNAMALSSIDLSGMPNVRVVLLKARDARGFVFYTNLESQKGREVLQSGKAAANFHWKSLRRQVRIRGLIEGVTDAEADEYFASRSRLSRLGAIASQQSRPLDSRETMMREVERLDKLYPDENIPRPSHWHGTRILPLYLEFWQDGEARLHDRFVFQRETIDQEWTKQRWYP
ncbi:MAG: pyridoxamine 5'-phosphate oxidase [Hyphomicrobiales bacterium]